MQTTALFAVLSLFVAIGPAVTCYAARWWLDRGAIVPPWLFPVLILAGGASGVFFALIGYPRIEALFVELWGAPLTPGGLLIDALLVPAAEELGKAFILLPFALTPWYRGPVDGLIYGLAAGAGFACIENYLYFAEALRMGGAEGWLWEVLTRAFPSAVVHGGATAAFGAFLGVALHDRRRWVAVGAPISGIIAALVVHGVWNWLILSGNDYADPRFTQAAAAVLAVYFMLGASAFVAVVHYEAQSMRTGLMTEVVAGRLSAAECDAVLNHKSRRQTDGWLPPGANRRRMLGALINLGLALHRYRMEGRGAQRVERFRAEVHRQRQGASIQA
jgi:RsiW-degrading membrane proteinase PrsW (M82 family)